MFIVYCFVCHKLYKAKKKKLLQLSWRAGSPREATSLKMIKTFYSISDWRYDHFLLWHRLLWIQSNFQVTKKQQQQQIKRLNTRRKRSHLVYFIQSQSELSQNETKKRRQQTEKPALSLQEGMLRSLRRTFFSPEDQHWRHVVSSPSRGNFRNVFVKSLKMLGF